VIMRRGLRVMASSFHLTNSGNCHVGIMECRKLNCTDLDSRPMAFLPYQMLLISIHFLFIKCVSGLSVRLLMRMRRGSWVTASSFHLTTSGNCHVGFVGSKWYEIGLMTCGITSVPNFIKFRPAIRQLLNA
jgi:hypothetical protein